ncbi:MAG: RNA 2',3'-cyclic phosphodiesterase [Chloroflexota bacterium]
MPEPWRLFVAVPLPSALRRDIASRVAEWQAEAATASTTELRWGEPVSWHVTLAFLGLTLPDDVGSISEAVRNAVTGHSAFSLLTGGLGAFPKPEYARVIWYGVYDDGHLAALARSVRAGLRLADEGALRPHITLARAPNATSVVDWLISHHAPAGELPVQTIELMRSHVGVGPARYEKLTRVELRRRL